MNNKRDNSIFGQMGNEDDYQNFMRLFVSHRNSFFAVILALVHNYSDAEDVLQETSMVMWKKYSDFEKGSDFRAWGMAIAKYSVLTFFHSRNQTKVKFSSKLMEGMAKLIEEKLFEIPDRLEALRYCYGKLSEKQKRLLDIQYRERMPVKEIALQIGVPANRLYKALSRTKMALRLCIEKRLKS